MECKWKLHSCYFQFLIILENKTISIFFQVFVVTYLKKKLFLTKWLT